MAHPALAGVDVVLPEPPHPEAAAAGPAGSDLPHIVTPCNDKVASQDHFQCRSTPSPWNSLALPFTG